MSEGFNCKNYVTDGGNKTVIGGTLEIKPGATVTGLPSASETTAGVVKKGANQAASTATTVAGLVTDFNALLEKLKAAGIITADE